MKDTMKNQIDLVYRGRYCVWEKVSFVFSLVMLSVFPFLMGKDGYYDMTHSRYLWFCGLTGAYLLAITLLFVFSSREIRKVRRQEISPKADISQLFLMGYLLCAVYSFWVSAYRSEAWIGQGRYEGLLTILLYASLFFCLSLWGEYHPAYFCGLALMAIGESVLILMQALGWDFITPEDYNFWEAWFFGTIGNVDCINGIAALTVPALVCAFVLWENRWRYLCLGGAGLMFYVELFSDTDSGKVGLLAALLVTLPFLLTRRKRMMRTCQALGLLLGVYAVEKLLPITQSGIGLSFSAVPVAALVLGIAMAVAGFASEKKEKTFRWSEKKIRRFAFALMVLLVLLALAALYGFAGEEYTLWGDIHNILHGELSYEAGNRRGAVWKLCLQFIREAPLCGTGPDTFISRSMPYYESGHLIEVYDFAHNDFLQIAVCLGLIALAFYVAWLVSLLVRLLRRAGDEPVLLLFISALVGYTGHVFFSFSIAIVAPLFWVMAGLADKCLHQIAERQN